MRRAYLLGGVAAAAAAAALWAARPAASADRAEARESGKSATASLLPVSQVVLFSSGVGHFQREGSVEGDARARDPLRRDRVSVPNAAPVLFP